MFEEKKCNDLYGMLYEIECKCTAPFYTFTKWEEMIILKDI